jgi:formylglycine-generating enzyme required for sulfatase activity
MRAGTMMRSALIVALICSCGFPSPAHSVDGASGADSGDGAQDGETAIMRMCSSLPAICGPDHRSSCCTSSVIPGGAFYRSYDLTMDGVYGDTSFPATVGDFRLDTYEVTVGRFRQFVNAGMGTQVNPPAAGAGARTLGGMPSQGGWDPSWNGSLEANTFALTSALNTCSTPSWTDTPGLNEALPIGCVTWFEAFAFCVWDGGFLPTEAEWNYAAAGGGDQRAYPWSNPVSSVTIDCLHANYDAQGTQYCIDPPNGGMNVVGSESPAGDGKWGQADLAGNAWEWNLDSYHAAYVVPCDNCADLSPAANHMVRGGAAFWNADAARVGYRNFRADTSRTTADGMRCARRP